MSENILDSDLNEPQKIEVNDARLARFWTRVAASIIDSLIFIPIIILGFYNMLDLKILPIEIFTTFLGMFYKVYMEWKYQATFGKIAMKIKVVNENLGAISLDQSMVRFSLYFMSYIAGLIAQYYLFTDPDFASVETLNDLVAMQENKRDTLSSWASVPLIVSVVMVVYDQKKQALHDKLANTYCVYVKE